MSICIDGGKEQNMDPWSMDQGSMFCTFPLMATLDTKCPKLGKIGLRMYFMCFYSLCPGDQVTRTGEWEIWSVSRRLSDSLGE